MLVLVRVALVAFLPLLSAVPAATAQDAPPDDEVELILFWGDGCPHCEADQEWLEGVQDDYPDLVVTKHEVWYNEANRELMLETAEELGFEASGVPTTIIGERYWVGFSDPIRDEMAQVIADATAGKTISEPAAKSSTIDVPLLGDVTVSSSSLVVATLVIGFVTAAMYAVYMVGIYSAMSVVGHLGAVQIVVAVVAGLFGIVSVKDYFAFKTGLSFTIRDSPKPSIYRRMRTVAAHHDLLPALGATVVLAVGVSLLETPCTAGFPVLWTGMLTSAGVGPAEAGFLFVLYMVPFLIDELLVFGIAVVTLRATKLQERHGRLLKLVAGTTMLALAGTLLVRPETMEDPFGALAVFGIAFVVAALVHLVTTRISGRREQRAPELADTDTRQ